jgi:hypothetical protein
MLSAHGISLQALYGYYESYGINFDTLDRILLDPFLIIIEIFVTINTPMMKVLLQLQGTSFSQYVA